MSSLFKYFIDANIDLFVQAPLAPPSVPHDYDDLPGPVADARNLAADWQHVGNSLRQAMMAEMASPDADVQEF
ncbi:MAG: hypothetical protein LBV79_06270 [Candidatus Adiutrix sp.]|jgi:hypothetical protein|nr:hypothetical protein [Candidatus Adiutrix sp.]